MVMISTAKHNIQIVFIFVPVLSSSREVYCWTKGLCSVRGQDRNFYSQSDVKSTRPRLDLAAGKISKRGRRIRP